MECREVQLGDQHWDVVKWYIRIPFPLLSDVQIYNLWWIPNQWSYHQFHKRVIQDTWLVLLVWVLLTRLKEEQIPSHAPHNCYIWCLHLFSAHFRFHSEIYLTVFLCISKESKKGHSMVISLPQLLPSRFGSLQGEAQASFPNRLSANSRHLTQHWDDCETILLPLQSIRDPSILVRQEDHRMQSKQVQERQSHERPADKPWIQQVHRLRQVDLWHLKKITNKQHF